MLGGSGERGKDKALRHHFTLRSEIPYGLVLPLFTSPICLKADALKNDNSHRPL